MASPDLPSHFSGSSMTAGRKAFVRGAMVALALAVASPSLLRAQASARVDTPTKSAETRRQHDSLTVHFIHNPRGKPAALSVGGKTAAQSRKFSGKPASDLRPMPTETPLPVRARTTKP